MQRRELSSYRGPIYVGVDAGSTTTKIAAIGQDKELLYTSYGSNQGSPLNTVVKELRELYAAMPEQAHIAAVLTTGYGEAIVKAAVHVLLSSARQMDCERLIQRLRPILKAGMAELPVPQLAARLAELLASSESKGDLRARSEEHTSELQSHNFV